MTRITLVRVCVALAAAGLLTPAAKGQPPRVTQEDRRYDGEPSSLYSPAQPG